MGTVLNSVYNNYLSTYTPKELTRFDTHKKSELRGVYNSIVKLNKESPWYLPTTSKATQHFAVDLKENARELHNTIANLGGLEENGLLNKKSAFSSNNAVVTVDYNGDPGKEQAVTGFQIEVESLASGQENLGEYLPDQQVKLPADTYSFDVAVNDMNYEFQFSIGEEETNKEVQERLVRLINNSAIGIKASLSEADGKTALKLTSESMGLSKGKSKLFSISDANTSKAKGTVDYFGLDYVSREATNANFTINGMKQTASSNHFTIEKDFEITLNSISDPDEPVNIRLKTDVESLTDNISGLIGGYNSFMKAANAYTESQAKSKQLVKELQGIAKYYGADMEGMGLSLQDDGTISVDQGLLRETALRSDDVTETFKNMKNLSNALLMKSNQISINPMDYVEKTIVAYKNPGHNYVSPYTMSAYSGMMFNGYC